MEIIHPNELNKHLDYRSNLDKWIKKINLEILEGKRLICGFPEGFRLPIYQELLEGGWKIELVLDGLPGREVINFRIFTNEEYDFWINNRGK